MAFNTYVDRFYAGSSTENPKSITGLGFQPDAIIAFNSRVATLTGSEFPSHAGLRIGVSDGAVGRSASSTSRDAQTTSDADRRFHNEALEVSTLTGALNMLGDFTSFDTDGFTVNFSIAPVEGSWWGYLALGGVTNVGVGNFLATRGGAQNQSITGLGFQPECIIFINNMSNAPDFATNDAHFGMGFATSSTEEGCIAGWADEAAGTSNTTRSQRTDRCIMWQTTSQIRTADFISMDADGFTVHWNEFNVQFVHTAWIALAGGGKFFVGNETSPTAAGTKATTGVGFQTGALLTAFFNLAANSAIQDHMRLGMGASSIDSDDAFVGWSGDTDNVGTTSADGAGSTGTASRHVVGHINTDAPTAWDENANMDSFDTDGFTLDWVTADSTARQFIFCAFEGTATAVAHQRRGVAHGSANMMVA